MSLTHVVNTDPDRSYEPYNAANPMPVSVTGGGDASAANQTTMISHLADIDTAVTGTLSVADTTAQGSLSNIDAAVTGILSVSDSVAQSSLSNIDTALTGTLSTSDSAAQASLATLAGCENGANAIQVDIQADATGIANQLLQTAGNSSLTSIDGKMSQGSDLTLANAQQVLCYGRDNGGTLDALRTDAAGHLEVVVDDFVKGQATMANSLPIAIASDQSAVKINNSVVTNEGSAFNAANLVTINSGAYSSVVSIANMNHMSIFYQDTAIASSDNLMIEVSPDGTNYFEYFELWPSTSGLIRTANMTDLGAHGLTHIRLKNSSSTDNYTNVKATVVGSP